MVFWPWGMWDLSYPSRDWTHTPCTGSWSPNYWTVREVPTIYIFYLLFNHSVMSDLMDCSTLGLPIPHHLPEFAQTHVHWVGDAIQPSHPFFSCLQSFPASGSFPVSQFFASGGQSIGVSASTSVLPMNIQDWVSLRGTGWISLQSKGLSRVFSSTTFWRHQFFGAQPFLLSNSHFCELPLWLSW